MGVVYRDLREWMSKLEEDGDLVRNRTEVDIRGDVAVISRKIGRNQGPAVLHENIQGYPGWRIFSDGVTTSRRRLLALNIPPNTPSKEITQVAAGKISTAGTTKPRRVDTGPCKEIKFFGDDIDLLKLPMAYSGSRETLPFLTAGISLVQDPETGWTNAGIRRFQLIGKNRITDLVQPYQHEGVILSKYLCQNKRMPIAVIVGTDPVTLMCSTFPAPPQVDELDYWAAFTGEPLQVVKCETNDILVPATAEIVIEGWIDPEVRAFEGPFPEFSGYYSGYRMCPVINVTAVTIRKDPIYRYMYMALPPSEGHGLGDFVSEVELYRQLNALIPEVRDVAVMSSYSFTTAVSIDKKARMRAPGLQRKVGMAVKSLKAGGLVKNVFIVDDDVDVHNMADLMWCMSVKFQPSKDIIVVKDVPGNLLDPSMAWVGHEGKRSGHISYAIFDCTEKPAPYDEGYKRGVAAPPAESIELVEKKWSQYGFK